MSSHRLCACLLGLALAVAGCAKQEIVVLLPEDDGRVGKLAVSGKSPGSGESELSEAFAVARSGGALSTAVRSGQILEDDFYARFGDVTNSMPGAPQSFILYFETGKSILADSELAKLQAVRTAIGALAYAEVEVVGHTDTVGDSDLNDKLSIDRARAARDVLIGELGLAEDRISFSGRGERQLAEPTEDEVASRVNRRVELRVR